MKFSTIYIILFLGITLNLSAQNKEVFFHVSKNSIELKQIPSNDSKSITNLKKYDNVIILKDSIDNWYHVKFNDSEGFINKEFLKEGKAIISTNSVRIGATCKDGTSSSATGRGACSHHGGVAHWNYKTNKSVRIQAN